METKVKNREWVKDAAIIFLAVLLVLTFFSNTIMNRTLPEVATAEVSNGSITAKVRGSGVVTANGKHQVKAKETRTIRSVMIKAGQEVNAGDVLFVLGEGDATALEQAKDTLRDLQYAYQKSAVSIPSFDYSSYYRAINNADKAVSRTKKELDEARKACQTAIGTTNITEVKKQAKEVEALKAALDAANAELEIAQANLDSLNAEESAARAEVENLKQQIAAIQAQIDALLNEQNSDPGTNADQNEDANQDGNPGGEQGSNPDLEQDNGLSNSTDPSDQIDSPNTDLDNGAQITNDFGESSVPDVSTDAGDQSGDTVAETVSVRQNKGRIVFLSSVQPINSGRKSGYTLLSNSSEIAELEAQKAALQAQLDAAQAKASHGPSYEQALEEAQKNLDKCQDDYYKAVAKYKSTVPASLLPYIDAYENAEQAYYDAMDDLSYAQESLAYAQESNNKSAAVSYIDLQQQAEKIKLQQEKIKSLAGDEENVITANVSGTVDTVDCTAGDTVLKDALLATIEVPDMGHTLSFSVTNDQAQRLRIGDTATISNYYWGNSITATLTSIRTDPKNPQANKLLTFDLTGDVTTGAELTISVGQKSANYDLIVPNSAIKSDTNGSYVLAVAAKSSPLGNRYTARRVSVEVLANDDNNSAVVADLGNGDYVITTSSAPINSGDMVRMADS